MSMKRALYILGLLDDKDIDWLLSVGAKSAFANGAVLVREGVVSETMFILLEGAARISIGKRILATLGVGEVIGEISLLDSRPPTATATAMGSVLTLAIPFAALRAKLRTDPAFAARMYRALGVFLAQRMRASMLMLDSGAGAAEAESGEDEELPDEINPDLLEEITLAGARFRLIMDRLGVG
jgi:CRP-like cAMP-binding protein